MRPRPSEQMLQSAGFSGFTGVEAFRAREVLAVLYRLLGLGAEPAAPNVGTPDHVGGPRDESGVS